MTNRDPSPGETGQTSFDIAALAYALQDSENLCKMADLSEADRKRYFERSETIVRWLKVHGATITPATSPSGDADYHLEDVLREAMIGEPFFVERDGVSRLCVTMDAALAGMTAVQKTILLGRVKL